MAKEGVSKFRDTKLYRYYYFDEWDENGMAGEFSKIFNVAKAEYNPEREFQTKYSYLVKSGEYSMTYYDHVLYLLDGSTIYIGLQYPFISTVQQGSSNAEKEANIKAGGGKFFYQMGSIAIDVNGDKKPNKLGRDLFLFVLGDDGGLYAYYGRDYLIWYGMFSSWANITGACLKEGQNAVARRNVTGNGCGARIMEEGWKMNY